jgi:hypothetical protein
MRAPEIGGFEACGFQTPGPVFQIPLRFPWVCSFRCVTLDHWKAKPADPWPAIYVGRPLWGASLAMPCRGALLGVATGGFRFGTCSKATRITFHGWFFVHLLSKNHRAALDALQIRLGLMQRSGPSGGEPIGEHFRHV